MSEGPPRLLLVMAVPPPVTGQAMAAAMLLEHLDAIGRPYEVVNLSRPFYTDGALRGLVRRVGRSLEFPVEALRKMGLDRRTPTVCYLQLGQSGRALMREDQYNSWDDCASAIDLMPGELQGRGNSGSNPGDGPDEGSKPANFTLETLDGETVNLNDFRGKPVVVQFGSYTCPAFRYEVDPLDKVMEEYGDKVAWLLVYGYEAHASDGKVSKDNVEAGIEVPTHKTLADREAAARTARRELDLTYPILIDGMDDAVTNAWDGHPNHGWVLDADGVVVSKQQRIQAETVREALDELL